MNIARYEYEKGKYIRTAFNVKDGIHQHRYAVSALPVLI